MILDVLRHEVLVQLVMQQSITNTGPRFTDEEMEAQRFLRPHPGKGPSSSGAWPAFQVIFSSLSRPSLCTRWKPGDS